MNKVEFRPEYMSVAVITDKPEVLDILLGGLEAKIIETVKTGGFEEGRELINLYLDIEKNKDLLEGKYVSKNYTF